MPDPVIVRPTIGTLTLGGSDFHCQVIVGLVATEQTDSIIDAMCGRVTTPGPVGYYLDLTYFQDWSSSGISKYLWDAADDATAAFSFSPQEDGTPGMTGTVYLKKPAAFSGAPRQPAQDRVRMPCTAKPTLTAGS